MLRLCRREELGGRGLRSLNLSLLDAKSLRDIMRPFFGFLTQLYNGLCKAGKREWMCIISRDFSISLTPHFESVWVSYWCCDILPQTY